MKLRLLIDTCVWLDLAKDYRQLPLVDALTYIWEANELELILPTVVVEEFERNKERVIVESKRSISTHFRLVREAVVQFAPDDERETALKQLSEIDHRIAVGGEAINDAVEQIEKLFADATKIKLTRAVKARAADRAITRTAPFHRQRNGIDDAILIENYIDALAARTDPEDVYGFVTHNVHDFSQKGGDSRLPHDDLEHLFDGNSSVYVTELGTLLSRYAGELMEEFRFDREFAQESRPWSELIEAERLLASQVWYNRHIGRRIAIEQGRIKLAPRAVWEDTPAPEKYSLIVDDIWEGALAAAKRTEDELGTDNIGPWTDFEWGMINGKLSAIRWVLGDEWDMLDT